MNNFQEFLNREIYVLDMRIMQCRAELAKFCHGVEERACITQTMEIYQELRSGLSAKVRQ